MKGDGGVCGNSNRNENNVISKDDGGGCNTTIEMNNKYQQITIDRSNANSIQLNNSNSDNDIGSCNRQLENHKDDKMETRRGDDMNRDHSFDSGL